MTTTTSARSLLRRALAGAAGQSTTRVARKTASNNITMLRAGIPKVPVTLQGRFFGAGPTNPVQAEASASPAAQADVVAHSYENLVEKSIKKLMTTNSTEEEEQLKPISNEDIEVRLNYFQKVFEEAELCLADLRETLFEVDDEQYREECACAEGSLNNAFTAYIDLLEDFRRSSEVQLQFYSEERNSHANDLKRLRKELDQIIEVAKNREKSMN